MSIPPANLAAAERRFRQANPRSQALFERAQAALPGGNTRTTIFQQPYPFYFDHGAGCQVVDVDGNARVDFINNYTSLIHGHAPPAVVAAVQAQVARGMSVAAPSALEVELAESIRARLPSMELLRFTNSGTEATMLAMRVARAHTGRPIIAKFAGSYHGTHDYAAVDGVAAGAVGAPQSQSGGVPAAVAGTVLSLPYNDLPALERILAERSDEVAAVIIEPVLGSAGVLLPEPGFLPALRELTERLGMLLIFDEVISFRLGYGGAQGRFGVAPDLTTLGKIIGGGLPVGAFGGREAIMRRFDPRSPGYLGHGGTFNANPATMAAGLATLAELTPAAYDRLEGLAADLKAKLCDLFEELGIPAQVHQVGSLFNLHFSAAPVRDYPAAQAGDRELLAGLYLAALNHGVAFTGRGMGCLSTPMTGAEIDLFVRALRAGLYDLGVA